jgi:Arm DNA-binding domain
MMRTPEASDMGVKLTDKLVRALAPPPLKDGKARNVITYDDSLPGFGARITSAGAISFVLNYRRKADGRERRATIGQFPVWSVAAARQRAAELRRAVDNGGDPVGELAAERGHRRLRSFVRGSRPNISQGCARLRRRCIAASSEPRLCLRSVA